MSLILGALLVSVLILSPCNALEGVPYITLKIEGKEYSVPIPNSRVEEDFYMLKKVTLGDEVAREMLLGDKDNRWIFIGDAGIVRWAYLTKTSLTVKEY